MPSSSVNVSDETESPSETALMLLHLFGSLTCGGGGTREDEGPAAGSVESWPWDRLTSTSTSVCPLLVLLLLKDDKDDAAR